MTKQETVLVAFHDLETSLVPTGCPFVLMVQVPNQKDPTKVNLVHISKGLNQESVQHIFATAMVDLIEENQPHTNDDPESE